MQYKDFTVVYDKPDIWRRPFEETLPKEGRKYLEYVKEILDFEETKKNALKEMVDTISKNVDLAQTKNDLNQKLSEIFGFYSKAMIPTDDFDPEFLLNKTNENTLSKKLQPWCKNLVFNIPQVIDSKPYANLINKFKDVPAFVCLAGPSLKNNREKLKELGKRGLVIAVDTSLRPLLDVGVTPHICVTHDANPNGCKFFLSKDHPFNKDNINLNDMPDQQLGMAYASLMQDQERLKYKYDTIGIFVNYCHPLTLLAWNGLSKCFYSVYDPSLPVYDNMAGCCNFKRDGDKLIQEEKGKVVGGSSVGHVATYIAAALGCNPICFVGLDLSYPGGKTYVEGASNQKDMGKQKLIEMEDLSGNKVPTNISMLSYKMVFERTLPIMITQTGIKMYNCTEDANGKPAGILEVGPEPKSIDWVLANKCQKEHDVDVLKFLNGEVK